jgi:hypothetical protein
MDITIETLELLADQASQEQTGETIRLTRLIRAYARIIAFREPKRFPAKAVEYGDIPNCDGSYAPRMEYRNFNGPKLLTIIPGSWEEIPETGDFYHDWRAVTKDRGLYVSPLGSLYGRETAGRGQFSGFPAWPGNCDVSLSFDFAPSPELSVERLETAENYLRNVAFPMVAQTG